MKQPYGIFAEVSGELKLIHTGSVRFSRANRYALKQNYPDVFFAHYEKVQPDPSDMTKTELRPVGERYKPKRLDVPDWSKRPERKSDIERELEFAAKVTAAAPSKRRRRKVKGKLIDYDAVDPNTGETLGEVIVDIIRERASRGLK